MVRGLYSGQASIPALGWLEPHWDEVSLITIWLYVNGGSYLISLRFILKMRNLTMRARQWLATTTTREISFSCILGSATWSSPCGLIL